MKHIVFRQFFRDFCSAVIYPAVFLLSVALLVLLSAGCNREDEVRGGKVGSGDYITFTATGGTPSAITKSSAGSSDFSADALSSTASLSGFGENGEMEQSYTIYYDFEKGENVVAPQGGVSHGSAGNLTQSSDTRFSGEVFETTVSGVYAEYLDWVEGDKITIAQKGNLEPGNGYENLSSNYEVKNPTRKADPKRSTATLSPVTGNGLQWRDGENYFAALYPDLGLTAVSTAGGSSSSYKASFSGTYEVMPSTQYCTFVGRRNYRGRTTATTKSETWYAPNMRYAYMAAGASGVSSSGTPLTLSFYPQFSSVEVKLLKPSSLQDANVKLTGAVLTGGNGASDAASLSGSPQMTLANATGLEVIGGSAPSITHTPATATYGSSITMKFKKSDDTTDDTPVLTESTPVSFTFLMLPANDLTQLELTLTLGITRGGVTQTETKKLQLKDANGWIGLPARKKLTITNMETWGVEVSDPLTIEPINAGSTTITINNSSKLSYSYSINGGARVRSTANPIKITNLAQGDKVALYQNKNRSVGDFYAYRAGKPVIDFDNPCYVYGNVMSLAGSAVSLADSDQFKGLFLNNTNLRTDASRPILLPSRVLTMSCYLFMFSGCTGLTKAPSLPAYALANSCYGSMFANCTSLEIAPELPAENLYSECYGSMFANCTSLTRAPILRAKKLIYETAVALRAYDNMFAGCSSLNEIVCLLTSLDVQRITGSWADGVAPTGTFVKHPDASVGPTASANTWVENDVSGIPPGWKVVDVDKYSFFTEKEFTVSSAGKKVVFSPGNLQAVIQTANSATNARWQFADLQYKYPSRTDGGSYTANTGDVVDVFTHPDRPDGPHAFGIPCDGLYSPTSTDFADWGEHLNIYPNSDHTSTPYPANTYRTPKSEELYYLMSGRSGLTRMYGSVEGVAGYHLLPDDIVWDPSTMGATSIGNVSGYEWYCRERAGVVFIPSAGYWHYLDGKFIEPGSVLYVWSASVISNEECFSLYYRTPTENNYRYRDKRKYGVPVRLVKDIN